MNAGADRLTMGVARLTWPDVVNSAAHQYGQWFTDDQAMALLWEYTGYPGFFDGDPVTVATRQLHDLFRAGGAA